MALIDNYINQIPEQSIDIGQLKDLILNAIQIKDNLFIRGAPGIGKSQIVNQVANEINALLMKATPESDRFKDRYGNECCYELREIRLATYEPSDISGIPTFEKDEYGVVRTKFSLPIDFPTDPKWKGIIFLDEMDQAQTSVLNACFKMIQDRMINDWHFPEGVTFIAAGNGNFCEGYTNEIQPALRNRFTNISVHGNLDKWIEWAIRNKIDNTIISFLKSQHPELYLDTESMKNGDDSFATPRGWEVVNRILKSNCSDTIKQIHINARIGFTTGTLFWSYYKKEKKLPNFKDILDGIIDIQDKSLDVFYSCVIGCLTNIVQCVDDKETRKQWIKNLSISLNKLTRNENVAFATKLIYTMCSSKDVDTPEFTKLLIRVKESQKNSSNYES